MDEYKKVTLDSYKKNAKIFNENFKGAFNLVKRSEFTKFMNLLTGKKILDVGCGSGEHSLWFANQGLDVTAFDLSPEMVEFARGNGVNAHVRDMEDIDFEESSFDGVWVVASLLHLKKENVPKVISSFSKILNKKGVLFIVLKEGNGDGMIKDTQNASTSRYFSYWQEKELLKVLEPHFDLIEFWKDKPRDATFLQFLLRNKK